MMSMQNYWLRFMRTRNNITIEMLNLILGGVLRTRCFSDDEVNLCRHAGCVPEYTRDFPRVRELIKWEDKSCVR